ncbi:MAG: hypothetical protein Q8N99_03235 [Nanoarchaeota archaeon]|nr:hypothetical protein [Nanoarchaeota archaeon]
MGKRGKRGIADLLTIIIVLLISIGAVSIAWTMVRSIIEENAEKIDIDIIQVKLDIDNKVYIDKDRGLLQLSISRGLDDARLNTIQINVLGDINKYYLLPEPIVPNEKKSYVLDINGISNVNEILLYPVSEKNVFGIGVKKNILGNEESTIDDTLPVLNAVESGNRDCFPLWNCDAWDNCQVYYTLKDISQGIVFLNGYQQRFCSDDDECFSDIMQKKECESKVEIGLKKQEKCSKDYLEVYDKSDNLISRLNIAEGKLYIQLIIDNTKYYPYCYNGLKDCDEDEIDCVYSDNGSCPKCG